MYAHSHISPWLLFAEAAPITLVAGALSWFMIERHFLDRSSQLKHEGILPTEIQSAFSPLSSRLDKLAVKPPIQAVASNPSPSTLIVGTENRRSATS
jgi:peptidoglycan/LPS O-acetylase OafA/YrhL